MAVIAVRSPLESLLELEYLIKAYYEACLISCLKARFIASFIACVMPA
jgi:hypothetical protein